MSGANPKSLPQLDRRELLQLGSASAAAAVLPTAALGAGVPSGLERDQFDPFGPPGEGYDQIREIISGIETAEPFVKWMWKGFQLDGVDRHGIWALSYVNLWWQSLPKDAAMRIKVAHLGRRLAQIIQKEVPESAAGFFWDAANLGFEALTKGVLDFLQQVPNFRDKMEAAWEKDPTYLYGASYMALAKMYVKLPAFPVSIGSLDKAYEHLEEIRPQQEHIYGLWHITYAEAEMARSGKQAALNALEEIDKVCPIDVTTRYTYELSKYLQSRFRKALEDGTYDKYTWDPLMEPVQALRDTVYTPPQLCPEKQPQGDKPRFKP